MTTDANTIVLINEARRTFSFPARTGPDGKGYRAPMLAPEKRIEVPAWYFKELAAEPTLKAVFNRKHDGIAVGRSSSERANERVRARELELEQEAQALRAELAVKAGLEARVRQLEGELAAKAESHKGDDTKGQKRG